MKKDSVITPMSIILVSTVTTWASALFSDFGKISLSRGGDGIEGIILILMLLIFSVFFKSVRKVVWKKNILIAMLISFLINLPVAVICISNHHYYN